MAVSGRLRGTSSDGAPGHRRPRRRWAPADPIFGWRGLRCRSSSTLFVLYDCIVDFADRSSRASSAGSCPVRVAFGMPTRVLQHTGIANVEKGSWPCWVRAFWLGPWIAAPGMTRRAAVRVATVSSGTHASWRPVVGLPVGRSHHTASPALKPFACNGAWDLGRVVRLGSAVPRLRGEPKSGSTDACAFVRVPGGGRRDGRTTRWGPESGRAWRPSLAAACSERLARLPPGRAAAAPLPKRNPKGRGCSARCSAQTGSVAAGSAPVQRTGVNMADPVLTGWSPQVCTPWWQSVRAQKHLHDV